MAGACLVEEWKALDLQLEEDWGVLALIEEVWDCDLHPFQGNDALIDSFNRKFKSFN